VSFGFELRTVGLPGGKPPPLKRGATAICRVAARFFSAFESF